MSNGLTRLLCEVIKSGVKECDVEYFMSTEFENHAIILGCCPEVMRTQLFEMHDDLMQGYQNYLINGGQTDANL